ncbi:hypothetical protein Btru_019108 [Bulinus truncatus]|nr:hypothetical protein Btru_019108 [Bulinus truncatus]
MKFSNYKLGWVPEAYSNLFVLELCFLALALACSDPEYLEHLTNHVRPFYEFYEDDNGNQIARPQWSVSMSRNSARSTCPWSSYINTADKRFPSRLLTARLVQTIDSVNFLDSSRPHTCLHQEGQRYQRHEKKICRSVLHSVPVVTTTGCRCGVNEYIISNITISVGYTCVFEEVCVENLRKGNKYYGMLNKILKKILTIKLSIASMNFIFPISVYFIYLIEHKLYRISTINLNLHFRRPPLCVIIL